jgi:maltodextrin utilization protein YvdJ
VINTFKETVISLQDNKYGLTIIAKPLKQVFWYFIKYLLLVSVLPLVIGTFLLTRYLPQTPKLIVDNFPDGLIQIKDKQLYSTINQPYKAGDSEFSLILNLEGSQTDLDAVKSGILFLKDKMVVKTEEGDVQTQTYDKIPDFSVDKYQLSGWISENRIKLWIAGLILTLSAVLLGTVFTGIFWVIRLAFGAVIFWLIGKFAFKKTITYLQSFNIAVYASILPLLISFILSLSSNSFLGYFSLFLFFFFGISWIRNLSGKETLPASLAPEVQAISPPSKKSRRTKRPS